MIILVRKTLRPYISRVESSERGIGLLGFGGNKAVRVSLFLVYGEIITLRMLNVNGW